MQAIPAGGNPPGRRGQPQHLVSGVMNQTGVLKIRKRKRFRRSVNNKPRPGRKSSALSTDQGGTEVPLL